MDSAGTPEALVAVAALLIPVVSAWARSNARKSGVAALCSMLLAVLYEVSQGEFRPAVLALVAVAAFLTQLGAYLGAYKQGNLNAAVELVRGEVSARLAAARKQAPDPVFGDVSRAAQRRAEVHARRSLDELPLSGVGSRIGGPMQPGPWEDAEPLGPSQPPL